MPCSLQRIIIFLLGMAAGWILLYAFLAWHGVDLVNHEGEWHIEIVGDSHMITTQPGDRGLHEVLHCFFWHRNDSVCE